jgi:D-methionine transport system ATP-binding protein
MQVVESIAGRVAILDGAGVAEVFTKPRSEAARRLVYPGGETAGRVETMEGRNFIRVVFKGNSSFEPVVASMVLRFRQKVNIMHADTRDVGGRAFGQMILQIPDDILVAAAMREYLTNIGLVVEEVKGYV